MRISVKNYGEEFQNYKWIIIKFSAVVYKSVNRVFSNISKLFVNF